MKRCSLCGKEKPMDNFGLQRRGDKTHVISRCKSCHVKKQTEREKKYRDREPEPVDEKTIHRFWSMVVKKSSGCWEWQGRLDNGYGTFHRGLRYGGNIRPHRFAYELIYGPIDQGKELHHRCENRRCVNPAHLQQVTRAEHIMLTPKSLTLLGREQTHCVNGHPFTTENTYLRKTRNGGTGRMCRRCRADKMKVYNARKKVSCSVKDGLPPPVEEE